MNWFTFRRVVSASIAIALLLGIVWYVRQQDAMLRNAAFSSGYILIGGVLFLALYNVRKRFPVLPFLGSSALWLQVHIYIGIIAVAVFVLHTGFRLPNGILETLLYVLFVAVAASGFYGLYITRTIPRKLTKLREQVVFERIPKLRYEVCQRAHGLVVALVKNHDAPTMSDYYTQRLVNFFCTPRSWWYYLRPNSRFRNKLLSELADRSRYFSEGERTASAEMIRLINRRDDLDYHHAMQGKLKTWLFAHISMSYALVLLAILHTILVHAFHGGMR